VTLDAPTGGSRARTGGGWGQVGEPAAVHSSRRASPRRIPDAHDAQVPPFDLAAALRRIRRRADLSQRELAAALGTAASVIAQAETRRRDLPVSHLV
jgi:ribosome-binding protein aMBF1 (putative translation factor)